MRREGVLVLVRDMEMLWVRPQLADVGAKIPSMKSTEMKSILVRTLLHAPLLGMLAFPVLAATIVRTDSGATPADILDTVNQFRADVSLGGGANPPGSGPKPRVFGSWIGAAF